MQVVSKSRRLARVLRPPTTFLYNSNHRFQTPHVESPQHSMQMRNNSTLWYSGFVHDNRLPLAFTEVQHVLQCTTSSMVTLRAFYSSEASAVEVEVEVEVEGEGIGTGTGGATESVKELYDKILQSVVEKRSMSPNAWLWSLIEKCSNHDDINLLFDILQHLRRFRLSNLRIHENFNCNLCREISKACARVGAIDFGKKALWKHNVYGLTPSIGSLHPLLLYVEQQKDAKLLVEIMKLMKKNDLPLQPGTADIVFRICYNTDKWDLLSKYGKKFVKAGVKLRQTSFDTWMEFAAKIGDIDSLWKIEKLRSDSMKQHTLASGFSCAKGFLLEGKPDSAAATIQVLNQTLSDAKKPHITTELQKLVSEWPLEVIKRQKDEDKKVLAAALQDDIPTMVNSLSYFGLEVNVNVEDLTKEGVLC